ncbi:MULTISPECIES: 16S rRNA (cytidine(1402)-2'-O)-methyltransferase [unclassified Undibacterium]|uniref:16S rRNA (cytidine(1402)-2'-O)-methyltransferase n=1 Tax=unclassified Undibacterium TaxID=2630295 RepID=UPI002AC99E80|nr:MULTISPECIES: 16S rRNA (cytidine(1402)-2'-O)-methyltransferase [unclassified Undibacterium]MEB0139941.1 16S rRNA (cytidine(1402)-2'-O)-methyltransferase [Undibacterium sp. CCC2.1]MEB0172914.1 16S rRNA (cytidine(1402)-2'-O)-methyltransferase [Undibacterium sp. CCC1.1]MEB0176741.1 16S rRNA (cytidine(1402)-2'-O)-methyltransferase [Undibacterium sp. CCC3.4]MEB0216668.1 16S rRNA (cytidine(1402)-2'-O)-methyltransferase [Undibacterium sp. 5I2]WPX44980.1 16S rRNA (cytidine(1402)-2'-O)-methyltransfe
MSLTPPPLYPDLVEAVSRQNYPLGTLYVVATPIGNVADISLRALHVLGLVDAIACEDTRNTAQLLGRYGINRPLIAAHQHNEREVAEKILLRLQAGERIALVSDAGTPGVSDPGAKIVDVLKRAGIPVTPLPGASAAISALSASGLLDERFYFVGFLPSKAGQREQLLHSLARLDASLIFYEAPHRICETVQAMLSVYGGSREIVLARELSKLFEEIHRCPLSEAPTWLAADAHREKGEYVILLGAAAVEANNEDLEARRVLTILLAECSVKQASALAAQLTGQKKNALYQLALSMKESH